MKAESVPNHNYVINPENAKVLILDGGGRGHAIALRLAREGVSKIFCAPGNAGTFSFCHNITELKSNEDILNFVKKMNIDLTIVGSEHWLEKGVVDVLLFNNRLIIGPNMAAAQLETSKTFARNLMKDIPCIKQPLFRTCYCADHARTIFDEYKLPLVVKADGLADGKGVHICRTEKELEFALKDVCKNKKDRNKPIPYIIEEYLEGPEMSVFAICDLNSFQIIGTAQDYKRVFDNNQGPNTGGMGAISPSPYATDDLMEKIKNTIINPVHGKMKYEGTPFTGILYVGLMLVEGEPYVIEFNARLGDPETQVILPLITSSFFELMYKAAMNSVKEVQITFSKQSAVTIVKSVKGYPGKYKKYQVLKNLESTPECEIIHAGTDCGKNRFWIKSGRVLNVMSTGNTLAEAINKAYSEANKEHFHTEHFRKDIGKDAVEWLENKHSKIQNNQEIIAIEN